MNNIRNLVLAILLASTGNAVAASSVDLAVKGSITPSACTPEMSNGGVLDVGTLSANDLNVETYTRLGEYSMQIRVTCESATLLALQTKDNRAGTDYRDEGGFGLGLINDVEKLGLYWIYLSSAVADGAPARIIESLDSGSTWQLGGQLWFDTLTSVASNSSLAPMPVQSMSLEMAVRPIIAPTNTLTLTNEVPIDGSATVTVLYL